MIEENKVTTEMPEEPELYEEPPRTSVKDGIGVVIALVLLALIAVAGYIWLTPGMSFSQLRPANGNQQAMAMTSADGDGQVAAAEEQIRCAQCGMFADKSLSHVRAFWSDGSSTDHDSWGCLFGYGADSKLTLTGAQVGEYNSALKDPANPLWLDAQLAVYLYMTARLAGSMPPYVAAFADKAAANAAQAELGGELRDFAALAAEWDFEAYELAPMETMATKPVLEHTGHSMLESEAGMAMPEEEDESQPATPAEMSEPPSRLDPLAAPHTHDHEMSCPYCGMDASASPSQVVVIWSNGDHEHFDSWDCLFSRAQEEGLEIVRGVARLYGPMDAEPRWLPLKQAWYLYDTNEIPLSMPPYVAAFDTHDAAAAAQEELGGEIVSFAGLSTHWE